MNEVAELLEALATIAWPLLLGAALFKLWPVMVNIIKSRGFTIKYGDAELSVQDASDQLRKQIEDLQNQVASMIEPTNETSLGEPPVSPTAIDNIKKSILWVDDKPSNNAYEVAKFKDDGFDVVQLKSTSDAVEWLEQHNSPSVIISDMGRNEGGKYVGDAGLQLILLIRKNDIGSPFFVYTSKKYAQKHHDQTLEAGGNGATASPIALFTMVSKSKS